MRATLSVGLHLHHGDQVYKAAPPPRAPSRWYVCYPVTYNPIASQQLPGSTIHGRKPRLRPVIIRKALWCPAAVAGYLFLLEEIRGKLQIESTPSRGLCPPLFRLRRDSGHLTYLGFPKNGQIHSCGPLVLEGQG